MLTKEARRNQSISNAVYDHILEKVDWFSDVKNRIQKDIECRPDKRLSILVEWIKSCEKVGTDIVKNEILKQFTEDGHPGISQPIESVS